MAQVSGFALGVVERMHRGAELCANGKREHIHWPPMNADERRFGGQVGNVPHCGGSL
jgi:hypothetical protein